VGTKVLIVDDSKLDRYFILKLLEYIGAEADMAGDVHECLRLLRGDVYDIVFIDYMMPEANGIEVLEQIRNGTENKNKNITCIALVSPDSASEGKKCLEAGFSNYLEKPVVFKELLAILIMYLPDNARKCLSLPSANASALRKTKVQEEVHEEGIRKDLSSVPEINADQGISLCGSEEGYMTALGIFYTSIDVKADEIENYYNEEDWKNYTIKVHALKSSANIIGAVKLYSDAKNLEEAGNADNIEMIKDKTRFLLEDYRSFKDKLSFLSGDDKESKEDDKPPASEKDIKDAYNSLFEFAQIMDFDLADMVVKSMKEHSLPKKDKENFDNIEKLLANLEWQKISEIVSNV
jgi:CheY-like chemotaxis protein